METEFLDEDGYPTDEVLNIITKWDYAQGWRELFELVESIWWGADWGFRVEETETHMTYDISTGGWSGNESIIRALQENYFCWHSTWQQSRRGGHHLFEIKKENDSKPLKELKLDFTGKATVIVESNWGPIQFSVNDVDIVTEVVRAVLKEPVGELIVNSYSADEEEAMKNMLRRIND
jgi:hypothetical protein